MVYPKLAKGAPRFPRKKQAEMNAFFSRAAGFRYVIFASAVAKHSDSLRPQHTVLALAEFLAQQIDLSHAKGEENALVADALARRGNVLISWEHEAIPVIAGQIAGNSMIYPQKWPSERFDLVWVFDRGLGATNWTFTQVPQMLLPGDVSDPIP